MPKGKSAARAEESKSAGASIIFILDTVATGLLMALLLWWVIIWLPHWYQWPEHLWQLCFPASFINILRGKPRELSPQRGHPRRCISRAVKREVTHE